MVNITKRNMAKNGVEAIVFNDKKWLNEKHIEEQLEHASLVAVTNRYPLKLKNQGQELQNCRNYQPCRKFLKENFAVQIIMDCRTIPALKYQIRIRI